MNGDPSYPGTPSGSEPHHRRSGAGLAVGILASCVLGLIAVAGGDRLARRAIVDLGPTDASYTRGFREIERDGAAYFRWSELSGAVIAAPVRLCGPGMLRLRARRHFEDPALLSVSLGGAVIGQTSIRAQTDEPYKILEFPFLRGICNSDASVSLESSVENQRPLGVALDWVEFRSEQGFVATPLTLLRSAAFLSLVALVLWSLSAPVTLSLTFNAGLAALMGLTFAHDPIAGERILRGGLAALVLTSFLGFVIGMTTELASLRRNSRLALAVITVLCLLSRAAFLDPRIFYPDYRVHALVQQTLGRLGLAGFLDQLFEIQYARSLGLQEVNGRWYPFPYPPGAYLVAEGVGSAAGLGALDASQVTAVVAAGLMPLLTAALGLSLGVTPTAAIAGSFVLAIHPLMVRRLALGYFPGLIGQVLDAVTLLLVIGAFKQTGMAKRRGLLVMVALLAAFLVYTQSVVNFGLLIGTLCLVELARRGRPLQSTLRISILALLAVSASVSLFYVRYAPVFENVAAGRAQPESAVLERLEQVRRTTLGSAVVDEDSNDPFAGATINPLRGLARLAARLGRFSGPFALAIPFGLWLLWRATDRASQSILVSWGAVAAWISLLAAGLPSPNGFQHLKDLEFVTPLTSLALGAVAVRIAEGRRAVALVFALAWLTYALWMFRAEFMDRLLPLAGI